MTYRNPKNWLFWPIKWISKCQSINYKIQHEQYNVNAYDLRIFWDSNNNIEFRHGIISYSAKDISEILEYAEQHNIILRILFEERNFKYLKRRSKKHNLKDKFIELCTEIEFEYPKLVCIGGRNTDTGELLYKFKNESNFNEIGYYSSTTSMFNSDNIFLSKLDDIVPYLYAKTYNNKNFEKCNSVYKDNNYTIIHFDFVNTLK